MEKQLVKFENWQTVYIINGSHSARPTDLNGGVGAKWEFGDRRN
jgi:hypothetical protein